MILIKERYPLRRARTEQSAGTMRIVRIELLVVPDCPNEGPARELVSAIMAEDALTAEVVTTVVATAEDAEARGFPGSPTFLIDGVDPFGQEGGPVGLACRVYRTSEGLAGLPDRDALASALASAASPGQ